MATYSEHQSPLTAAAWAALAACACSMPQLASAQESAGASTNSVTITGRSLNAGGLTGFGDMPLARTPMQAQAYGSQQLSDAGVARLGDITRLDASVGDAYNAEGYWTIVSVRGYSLDNRFNYRRDGLPINAETAIALDNKDRLELLKGASGIQAGTSAPGGLVNLVVKRATGHTRTARLELRQPGAALVALDLGDRFGADSTFGLRLNAAYERLNPQQRNTQGERTLLALAGDARLATDTVLQVDIETSHQRQPSVAGYSMLGDRVPSVREIDPRRNLNDQPWRQPVVLDGTTASLRLQQALSADWTATLHAMQQRLKSDDRTAFPFGVYDPATFDCAPCNRFASDGSFTYWQFISDNERRTSTSLLASVAGRAQTGIVSHNLEGGVLVSRYRGRFQDQVFDIAGTGRIDGSLSTPPSAGIADANTQRSERSTEFFVRDAMRLDDNWQLWAGLRHTRMHRAAERTSPDSDGTLRATPYTQALTTPWAAASYQLAAQTMAYASWGQGMESDVAPNRRRYINAGQALPALKSRQFEAGIKHESDNLNGSVALFDIDRPIAADLGACSADNTCTRAIDGTARHRGVEANGSLQWQQWLWQASVMWLHAQRRGSQQASVNGQRPTNVPQAKLRWGAEYRVAQLPGLALGAHLAAEGRRTVLPEDSRATIPAWWRLDLGARWTQTLGPTTLQWRLALDNATNQRAWKESPYQFGHVYLYPLSPRTWRASVQAQF